MHNIGSGIVSEDGSGVWQVLDDNGTLQAEFIHAVFSFIEHGTRVYFVDLDLDRLCENVQVQLDVNELVLAATPDNGFSNGTELRLRSYIMDALLASLQRVGDERAAYRASLAQKMIVIAEGANALPSKRVTIALLKKLDVTG